MKKIKTYFMLLTVFLLAGCERPTENTPSDDGLPPAVPVNVRVYSAQDGLVVIEWQRNVETDFKGCNIFRSADSVNFSLLDFTTLDYYFDDSLEYNTTYFYRISALDIENRESEPSEIVSAKPVNVSSPRAPRFLEINARNWEDNISVFLSWQPNTESDIAGYEIFRGLNAGFSADSANLAGFSPHAYFTDYQELQLSQRYYYKIKAVDKGGLKSNISSEASDIIYEKAELIFPADSAEVNYFPQFKIKTVNQPVRYKIIVQTNKFFGEFWSAEFSSSVINDTLGINFTASYIQPNVYYYWRIITFSENSEEPNSITKLSSFIIRQ